jgi:hypothetical protein
MSENQVLVKIPAGLHPDTTAELQKVVAVMAESLMEKQRGGTPPLSWMADNWEADCARKIQKCIHESRYADAMNYLMFARHHGFNLRLKSSSAVPYHVSLCNLLGIQADCTTDEVSKVIACAIQSKGKAAAFRTDLLKLLGYGGSDWTDAAILHDIAELKKRQDVHTALKMFQEVMLQELKIDLSQYPTDQELILAARDRLRASMPVANSCPTTAYVFQSVKDQEDYSDLLAVLLGALDQAAYGKGRERHANDAPFAEQPMQAISDLLASPLGMAYQVAKKVVEATHMPSIEQQERELFGAINYTAGMIIWLRRHNKAQ